LHLVEHTSNSTGEKFRASKFALLAPYFELFWSSSISVAARTHYVDDAATDSCCSSLWRVVSVNAISSSYPTKNITTFHWQL